MVRSTNALALLASGDKTFLPLVKREAEWAAAYTATDFATWYNGYVIMLLSEYEMATDDSSMLPGLHRLALESAKGQSAVGSWGHGFALPSGILSGYGMMNAPGVPLTISLVMARAAGIKDPEVTTAIEKSAKLIRFYIGSQVRTPEILKVLVSYGAHAKSVIPQLRQAAEMFDKGEGSFPKHMSVQKAADARKAIAEIEAATNKPELRGIR